MPKSPRKGWLDRAKTLPTGPGVYIMKASDGEVIYVGKANNLRSRVSSYFQEGTSDYRAFVGILAEVLADLETVVTSSEKEALLLERELIRQHEPRFNVIWRDDKQYLMLRIDAEHPWPRVQVVRNAKKDRARYFGPFHSASAARQTLRVVNRHFQLRTCRDSVLNNRRRPCLEYQIGRCPAPCCLPVAKEQYQRSVDDVLLFLDGKQDELVKSLDHRMHEAAERLEYEVAARYRDQLRAVRKTLEQQHVAGARLVDRDAYGLYREGEDLAVALVEVRGGRVRNVRQHSFEETTGTDEEIMESFLLQRHATQDIPPEIILPFELSTAEVLEDILSERRGRRVRLTVPQRGERMALVNLAAENAEHGFQEQRLRTGALEKTLEGLRRQLRLRRTPVRMECFDISNLGPHLIVASQVVFEKATPAKSKYRRYRIKSTDGQNDFASMYEVLSRRFRRGLQNGDLPDLVVIDGGKGQLNVAQAVFRDLGIDDVDLVSLAKSRVTGSDDSDQTIRSPERVFLPSAKDPVIPRAGSPEILLLARLRDEAHRFAITFHQELRRKAKTRSGLEDVPGIGPKRRRALLTHFGSLKRLRSATLEEIASVPGVGRGAGRAVYNALHPGRSSSTSVPQETDATGDSSLDIIDSMSRNA